MIKKVKLIQVRLRLNTHSHRYMPKIALIRVCVYVCQLFNHKFSLKEDMITEDFTLARKKQTISFLAESFFVLFCSYVSPDRRTICAAVPVRAEN